MTNPPVEPVVESQEPQDNPEWNNIWEDVSKTEVLAPFQDKFKEALRPHLQKMDERYQEVSGKAAAWKDFEGVNPEDLKKAQALVSNMTADPVGFYDRMGQYLQEQGLTKAEAKAAVEEMKDDDEVAPEIKEVKDQQSVIQQQFDQFQQEREASRIENETQAVVSAHDKDPAMAGIPINFDLIYKFAEANLMRTGKVDVKAAYKEWADIVTSARSFPTKSSLAPDLTPSVGGGGLPLNQDPGIDAGKLNDMKKDDRIAAIVNYIKRSKESAS